MLFLLVVKQVVEESGSERLKGAIPLICKSDDVVMCSRQIVHGSFANTGFEPRVTINFGFHKRSSVLNVQGAGMHCDAMFYDEALINKRSKMIGYAIDARRQQYSDEPAYQYQPLEKLGEKLSWNKSAREEVKDYNLYDLSI